MQAATCPPSASVRQAFNRRYHLELIDRIILRPDEDAIAGYVLDIEGALAGILSLCNRNKEAAELSCGDLEQIKLVAGVGFEPTTFRL